MGRIVKFRVEKNERWESVASFFTTNPAAMGQLLDCCDEDKDFNFDTLTVKGMLEAATGRIPAEFTGRMKRMTVGQAGGLLKALQAGLRGFIAFLEKTQPPMTLKQEALARGMMGGSLEESVLWTLKNCFSLHGFEEAHALTVYEFKAARKNVYNEALVAYRQAVEIERTARG